MGRSSKGQRRRRRIGIWFLPFAVFGSVLVARSDTWAQADVGPARLVRVLAARKLGVPRPVGVAWSPRDNAFLVATQSRAEFAELRLVSPFADVIGSTQIQETLTDPVNMVYDARRSRLLILQPEAGQLVQVSAGPAGGLDASTAVHLNARTLGVQVPGGMAVDPNTGTLYVLDSALARVVRAEPGSEGRIDVAQVSVISLGGFGGVPLRGLALDPSTRHLYLLSPEARTLYEVDESGVLVSTRNLSRFGLHDPQGMTFAPSGDTTDDPARQSLYVADAGRLQLGLTEPGLASDTSSATNTGGGIVELSLAAPTVVTTASTFTSAVVNTTLTSQWSPPAPDTSDVVYLPASNTLLVVDSEVEEMSIWAGANEWETTLGGTVLDTSNLTSFTNEPTGISVNPANRHLFYSDDDARKIFEVDPGPDGRYHTGDDVIHSFSTSAFGSGDPEDVTYDPVQGVLFLIDGVNAEVYRIAPGANGVFNGVPPGGDDQLTHFDVSALVTDPECMTLNTDTHTLYIAGRPDTTVQEITTSGALVQTIDISAANAVKTAGLGYGLGSTDPSAKRLYVVQRGVDNDSNPKENDGKLWEMTLPAGGEPVNSPPIVSAGADRTVTLPASATLDGTVSDDGLPNPPASVTTTWSTLSGPGTVTFGDANAVDTTATFSVAGSYVLRLTASDSVLSASDDVAISVLGEGVIEVAVGVGSDDAEESVSGKVSRSSNDLELVYNTEGGGSGSGNQTVGLRFVGVNVPKGAPITTAWVQFQADEAQSEATALTIQGQTADNPPAFSSTSFGITSRPRTAAAPTWVPPAWSVVGERGSAQRTTSLASVIQEIVNRPGWASGNALVLIITGTGHRTADSYEGSVTAAPLLHVEYDTSGANQAPVVNAGPDQTITLPASASLSGSVTDDGLPNPPGTVTTTWSKLSGTGTVTFGDASALSTTATFSAAGSYVLRLTANDSALNGTDDVAITVNPSSPTNQAPVVNAGPDQTITLPASASLVGSYTDDGLPNPPGTVTTTWSKLSGPGTVTFGDASALSTTASFSAAGSYVLRLTANDSALSGTDDVAITVNPSGPVNQAPVVNAGPDQTVTLPASASLSGSYTDDGLPNPPGTVTTTWSKLSGPGTVTFGDPNALSTTASFSTTGSYVLRLTANDSALSGTDDVAITVNAAGQQTLSVVKRATIHSDIDAGSYSFAPVTVTANRLYVVFLSTSHAIDVAPSATSLSGAGLAFTEIGTPGGLLYSSSPGVRRIQAWRALVGFGAGSGAIAISLDGISTGMDAVLLEFDGVDTSGTNGSGAVVQSTSATASSATSLTLTLAAFGGANNRPVAFFNHRVTELTNPEPGCTELDDASHSSPSAGAECEWNASTADTTPSASWATAAHVGGFAIEVRAGFVP